jgi:GNAT superfamily N-acetyltransferase
MLEHSTGAETTGGTITASATTLERIRRLRDMYRLEMSCQIVFDSIHDRDGWTREYLLSIDGAAVGYGSVAVGGPWTGEPTVYEFYVVPTQRLRVFELFRALLDASGATHMEVQSNGVLATVMLHTFASPAASDAILFHDAVRTTHAPPSATFREPTASEAPDVSAECRRWRGVVEIDGAVAASGGILFHYNRPFGDIYMEVAEPYRRRGLGAFIVQELKLVCYEGGHVPAARCSPTNVASRRTLQKAGFVPCGHILKGRVASGDAARQNSTPSPVTGLGSSPSPPSSTSSSSSS